MRKTFKLIFSYLCFPIILLGLAPFFFKGSTFKVYAQFGNSISGQIYGTQRTPLSDVYVELLDDFSRTISRTRTNAAGRYLFSRVSSGRFKVRVLPYGTNYDEQEQEVEIQNFSRDGVVTGFDNAQRDFYLRSRRKEEPNNKPESVFVQEVPAPAKEAFNRAVGLLEDKKEEQALKELKSSIELFPNYFEAIEKLGIEYVRLKRFQVAYILLAKATEINPRSYKSWYGLAYSLHALNAFEQAYNAVEKANSLNQFSVESRLLTGVLLRQLKLYEKSEKELKKANELAKGSVAEVHWHLALLYGSSLKRYREAADELELFLKVRPDSKDSEEIKKLIKQFREKEKSK